MLIPIRLPASASTNQGPSGSPNTPAAAGSDLSNTPATASAEVTAAPPDEWSLIELNGSLNCTGGANHAATGEGLGGLPLGQLSFPVPDKPVLVIGAHKLEGVMVTLPKPFLIMRKRKLPCKGTLTQGKGKRRMSGGSEGAGEETTTPKGKSSNSAGMPGSLGSSGRPMTLTDPSTEEDGQQGSDTEYEVVGIVRQKLLFKERPKPIVSRHLLQRRCKQQQSHPQQPSSYMSNPPPSPPPRRRLRQRSWEPLRAVAAAAAAAATTAITIVALISSLSVLPTVNSAPNLRQDMKAAATDSPPSNNSTIITTARPTCRARAFNDLGDSASNLTPAEIFALEPPVFPSDFVWGVATSAYQIEGAVKEDGRGASIWDIFAHTPGKISGDTTGDVACDHYHRYEEDIALMRSLGVSHYRFSISWSRILPTGTDEQINDQGIAFYNNLINALLEAGIQPAVTLYHWDLPQTLQEQGGWQNSSLIVPAFAKYADLCFYTFGDRVKMWFTINEPWSTAVLGHGIGVMAPGIKDQEWAVYVVGHTQLLAHAAAVKVYRDKHQDKQRGKIGIVLSTQFKEPLCDTSPSDIEAAERNLQFYLGWFASPIFNGDYPAVMRERVGKRLPSFSGEEMKEVKGSVDFLGINTYGSSMITDRGGKGGGYFADVSTASTGDPAWSQGESSWLWIAPAGMRKLLRWVKVEYDSPVVYVTENGLDVAGEEQWGEGGQGGGFRKDAARVDYIKNYLAEVGKARKFDGVDVRGYFVWSLLDNFEWAEGFSSRFGLVRVMFKEGQKRVPKDSFFSYQELIRRFVASDGKMSVGGGEGANTAAAPLPPALVAKVPPPAIAASPAFTIAPAGDPGAMLPEAELP